MSTGVRNVMEMTMSVDHVYPKTIGLVTQCACADTLLLRNNGTPYREMWVGKSHYRAHSLDVLLSCMTLTSTVLHGPNHVAVALGQTTKKASLTIVDDDYPMPHRGHHEPASMT